MIENGLILRDKLDWRDITPEDFEKLVFFLLDAIGAKNIIWRKGGEGISSSDQGRDLECTFHIMGDKGKIEEEYWWVEIKYRKKTLEKTTVQKGVTNSKGAPPHIKKFLIITNTQVSNATIEWVKEFDKKYPNLKTIIWQFFDLEQLILKHPRILLRFFPTSLTIKGKAQVIKSQFMHNLTFPSIEEISDLWDNYEKIDFDSFLLLPVITSEVNFGDISKRPWLLRCDREQLIEIFITSLCNLPPFIYRGMQYSREQEIFIKGVAYIIESAIFILGSDFTSKILKNPFEFCSPKLEVPEELLVIILKPIFTQIFQDLLYPCIYTCEKIDICNSDEIIKSEYINFFDRFKVNKIHSLENKNTDFLYIGNLNIECPASLGKECPLLKFNPDEFNLKNIEKHIKIVEKIIQYHVKRN